MIKIKAFLRQATKQDLFTDTDKVIKNVALFYKSIFTEKFQGPSYTLQNIDLEERYELLVKLGIPMLYVLNFSSPGTNDIEIQLELKHAKVFDIKEGPKDLRIGRMFFIKNTDVTGPFLLNTETDPLRINNLIQTDQMYMINRSDNIKSIVV